jgi:hypothetical protein
MIYDCFTFSNEFDLLELRLRILNDVVDRFVLCEAPFTFRGTAKPLHFAAARERFAAWGDRIVALAYPGPIDADPWRNEWGQRDHLATALGACAPDDLLLLGDCDEIPDPQLAARRPSPGRILGHQQRLSIGYVNRISPITWIGTRAIAAGDLPRYGSLTAVRGRALNDIETVVGGWHFTSLGGAAAVEQKMRAYSHSEYDVPYFRDPYRLKVTLESEHDAAWIPLDDSFPSALRADPRWSAYVWQKPTTPAQDTPAIEHAHGCLGYVAPDAERVYAVTPDVERWASAGRERFGTAFGGAAVDLAVHAPHLNARAWVVIDGAERLREREIRRLRETRCTVVAYTGNARSRDVFDLVVNGSAFPPGRAQGLAEMHHRFSAAGWDIAGADRITIPGVFAVFAQMAEELSVEAGRFVLANIARERLIEFLAQAFVFTLR